MRTWLIVHCTETASPSQSFQVVKIENKRFNLQKSVIKNWFFFRIWEKQNWRNKGINKHQQPDSSTHDTSTYCPCVDQVSPLCTSQSLRKERWIFLKRKKNEEIKERISRRNLVLFHIKQMDYNIKIKIVALNINFRRNKTIWYSQM